MKAVRFLSPDGETRIGALLDDHVRDAGPAGLRGFDASDEQWQAIERASGPEYGLTDMRLLHPTVPQKIAAIGLNYRSHAEETGLKVPEVPIVFAKFPSALIGPEEPIVIPREETRPDYEGEVALIVGRRSYRVEGEAARAAIGGISVINDVSGRRAQLETPLRQFTLGKSFDTFAPMGPGVAHPDELDLGNLSLRTVVSGELMQDSSTSLLLFSLERLIEYISAGTTLEAGDVIASGTPAGVGDEREPPRYLREGDVVEVTVEGVGTLRNPVRLER